MTQCPWIADLDDWFSDRAIEQIKQIRMECKCEECKQLREEQCSDAEPA